MLEWYILCDQQNKEQFLSCFSEVLWVECQLEKKVRWHLLQMWSIALSSISLHDLCFSGAVLARLTFINMYHFLIYFIFTCTFNFLLNSQDFIEYGWLNAKWLTNLRDNYVDLAGTSMYLLKSQSAYLKLCCGIWAQLMRTVKKVPMLLGIKICFILCLKYFCMPVDRI